MQKIIFILLFLFSASFSNELVDALKGKKSLLETDVNIKYNKKPTCDKEILEAIEKNRISFFAQKRGELKALNDCLASEELTPLMMAAYSDKTAIVKLFLSDGVNPNEVSDKGYAPLHFAAFYGNYEIIIALLDAKADINAKNSSGQTPLMIAAYYGNAKSVSLLQARGADTSITDKAGLTAKELAVKKKKREVLRVIR